MNILTYEIIQKETEIVLVVFLDKHFHLVEGADYIPFVASNGFAIYLNREDCHGGTSKSIYLRMDRKTDASKFRLDSINQANVFRVNLGLALDELVMNGGFKKVEKKSAWDLTIGDRCWLISLDGGIAEYKWADAEGYVDEKLVYGRFIGNCFATREDALKEVARRKAEVRLIKLIADYNKGWVPDWKERNQSKYAFIYRNNGTERCELVAYYSDQHCRDVFYLKDKQVPMMIFEEMQQLFIQSIGGEYADA